VYDSVIKLVYIFGVGLELGLAIAGLSCSLHTDAQGLQWR